MSFHVPHRYRIRAGERGTTDAVGNNGAFAVPIRWNQLLYVIASDGEGWEHVSVSRRDRCPTWEEMCLIKEMFWDDGDCVVQFHPPKSEYVNVHPFCLHLWRPVEGIIATPPRILVG